MKYTTSILLILIGFNLTGQTTEYAKKIGMDLGIVHHYNSWNSNNYAGSYSEGDSEGNKMTGIELRLRMESPIRGVDFVLGTIIEKCWDSFELSYDDYKLNGGGVYAGINPKLGTRNIAVTALMGIGVFAYQEHIANVDLYDGTEFYEKNSSRGLGAISSIGVAARVGPVGVNPQIQAIFSGGDGSSFLFWGFVMPLTFEF
jgi:hypothetical protein